jgi:hypothetical protein
VGTNHVGSQQKTVVQHAHVCKPRRDGVDAQHMDFALFNDLNGAEKVQQFVREITSHGGVVLIGIVSFTRLDQLLG